MPSLRTLLILALLLGGAAYYYHYSSGKPANPPPGKKSTIPTPTPIPSPTPIAATASQVARVTSQDMLFAEAYVNKRKRCEELYFDYADKTSGQIATTAPETIRNEFEDLGCIQMGF